MEDFSSKILKTHFSDHYCQVLFLDQHNLKSETKHKIRFMSNEAIVDFCDICNELFENIYCAQSVDAKYNAFINTFLLYFNKHFPLKITNNKKPKFTFKTPELIAAKNEMINFQRLSAQSLEFKQLFKNSQQIYNQLLQKEKNKHYEHRLANSKNKSKTSWQIINELTQHKKTKNDQPYFEDSLIGANSLNRYFNEKACTLIAN
uniref:Uncharacterized protein LOC114348351 n=1 Tax=Diabrotica virgifera virgifera TaxID=50390 RepID=A0A6P7HAM7_DIAVI